MNFSTLFLSELKNEAANTRKMLTCIPDESISWKPNEKSMTLGSLAGHVGEIPSWLGLILNSDHFNFATANYQAPKIENNGDILSNFDDHLERAVAALEAVEDDSIFHKNWSVKNGEHLIFDLPKHVAIRNMVMNHIVHHRAQISVYLRSLNLPIPGMYGPSADETLAS